MAKIVKVKRKINYYELNFEFINESGFDDFFETITKLAKTRAKIRYQKFGDKFVFIQGISNKDNLLKGKMRCVRKDLFPELMNTKTDKTKGIDAKEEEGIVETTHFIIDYRKDKVFLALEYNHYGSRIGDFINYVAQIGVKKELLNKLEFKPIITEDELERFQRRINNFSEFIVKVHKDNIEKIKELDKDICSALEHSIKYFSSETATLVLKFDYRQNSDDANIKKSVFNILRSFHKDKSNKSLFNQLSLKAEDGEKNNLIENFDLLLEKVHSEVRVQKKKKYRTIISADMFNEMAIELNEKKFN